MPPAGSREIGAAHERRIHGQGTPEAAWRNCVELRRLPPLSLARRRPALLRTPRTFAIGVGRVASNDRITVTSNGPPLPVGKRAD